MSQMTPRIGIVVNATQKGATFKNFDIHRFKKEIAVPTQILLATFACVHRVILVVMCDPKLGCAEEWKKIFLPAEETPKHTVSPTSKAILKHLSVKKTNGRVGYLNIFGENVASNMQYGSRFALNQGAEYIIQVESVPSPQELQKMLKDKFGKKSAKKIRPNQHVAHA